MRPGFGWDRDGGGIKEENGGGGIDNMAAAVGAAGIADGGGCDVFGVIVIFWLWICIIFCFCLNSI
jgi:hypothetical protein